MMAARGVYRTKTPESGAQYAAMVYGHSAAFEVPEQYYRDRGYTPNFDDLPTKDQYDALQAGTR